MTEEPSIEPRECAREHAPGEELNAAAIIDGLLRMRHRTRRSLASEVGKSPATVNRHLNGQHVMNVDDFRLYLNALGCEFVVREMASEPRELTADDLC